VIGCKAELRGRKIARVVKASRMSAAPRTRGFVEAMTVSVTITENG
jgi:hypothetical protein